MASSERGRWDGAEGWDVVFLDAEEGEARGVTSSSGTGEEGED